ncbi:MAG TPA: hypothetical protein VM681_02285 [Candidatus Thermoplasmatota archaeon]|nr:hypothetical protein [Candidatus Thermoplasmatota archaeon]
MVPTYVRFGAFLAAFVLLAGCIGSPEPVSTASVEGPAELSVEVPLLATLGFGGCVEQIAVFTIPSSVLGPLPPGFKASSLDPAGATSLIVTIAYRCEQTQVGDAQATSTVMLGLLAVDPPAEHAGEGFDHYGIVVGGWADTPGVADVLASWKLPNVGLGKVRLDVAQTPLGQTGSSHGEDEDFWISIDTVVTGSPTKGEPSAARLYIVEDATLLGYVDSRDRAGAMGLEGTAVLRQAFLPIPVPFAQPGLGFHIWGEGYGFDFEYVPLKAEA